MRIVASVDGGGAVFAAGLHKSGARSMGDVILLWIVGSMVEFRDWNL